MQPDCKTFPSDKKNINLKPIMGNFLEPIATNYLISDERNKRQ